MVRRPENLVSILGCLMVSALDSVLSSPGLSLGQGTMLTCVVFLGKTLYSYVRFNSTCNHPFLGQPPGQVRPSGLGVGIV